MCLVLDIANAALLNNLCLVSLEHSSQLYLLISKSELKP